MNKLLVTSQKGVTLIETLLVMTLMSTLLLILASIFTASIDVQQSSGSYSATVISGRFIVAKLNYDIAHAASIISPAPGGSSSPTLVVATNSTSYLYGLSGNNLAQTIDAKPYSLNSDDVTVSGLSFKSYDVGNGKPFIIYSFTVTSVGKTHGSQVTQTFTDAAGTR
ncbi:MAG: type II secretion system protein J [Candidatus Saccharimonadales bacterium]